MHIWAPAESTCQLLHWVLHGSEHISYVLLSQPVCPLAWRLLEAQLTAKLLVDLLYLLPLLTLSMTGKHGVLTQHVLVQNVGDLTSC